MSNAEIIVPFPLSTYSEQSTRIETFSIGTKQYDIKVPPNVGIGQKLRLKGIAHHIDPTLKNGDVLLLVLPSNSMIYQVKRDVHMELPLDWQRMEKGGIERVTIENRKFDIKIPSGITPGKKIRMGEFAHICNGGYTGDIILKIVPKNRPKRRFSIIFDDLVLVKRKLSFKFKIPLLSEIGFEYEFVNNDAEIKLNK